MLESDGNEWLIIIMKWMVPHKITSYLGIYAERIRLSLVRRGPF
jgi:hypothetical protein